METPTSPVAPRRWWPHARAALIALHLLAVFVLAIPDAGKNAARRTAWRNPTVQAELDAWAKRLTAWGISIEPHELEARMWALSQSWSTGVAAAQAPFRPYSTFVGVRQTWRMFVAPHRHPTLLHVDIDDGDGWRPIYVARSDEHTWRSRQLDHARLRGMIFRYGWANYRPRYVELVDWIAARCAEDFPDATRVRVRLYEYRTRTPEEVRAAETPPGEFRDAIVRPLPPATEDAP